MNSDPVADLHALTDRDRIRALYGEPVERPGANDLYERILAELDLADRLIAGAEAIRCSD